MPIDTKSSVFYFGALVYENVIYPHSRYRNKCITVHEKSLGTILPASKSEINILYCDDMSYSGSQLSQEIKLLSEYHSPTFFKFLVRKRTRDADIPIYCAGHKRLRFFSLYSNPKFETYNPKFTLKHYHLTSMNDALLLYQNAGTINYPSYQWVVLRRESDKNDKIKFDILTSWYSLKEFLEKNRSLKFITQKFDDMVDVKLQYITPAIFNMKCIHIYVGIPYFTSSSLQTIEETRTAGIQIILGKYEKLPTIGDLYQQLPLSVSGKQRFMYFLLTHFNYYYPQPLQEISDDYLDPDANPKLIALVWFDHKLADPISTISVLLGCGLVVPYTFRNKKLIIKGPPKMLGSLLKNCGNTSETIKKKRMEFLQKFYSSEASPTPTGYKDHKYNPQDKYACGNCPAPFYKDNDLK